MTVAAAPGGILFDLDGTLWDTCAATAQGWTDALRQLGISDRVISTRDVVGVCGRPFRDCIEALCPGLIAAEGGRVADAFDACQRAAVASLGGHLFLGVPEGLEELERRYPLFIVSNCEAWYLDAFCEQTGLRTRFREALCYGATRRSKGSNISDLVRRFGLTSAVYVGDTQQDADAAAGARVDFAHVTYGFGEARASLRFRSFPELTAWFVDAGL